jgi:integrase
MGVYRKGRYWHFDFVIRGRRYFGSTGQENKRNAEAVERTRRLEAATGIGADAGDLTLDLAASRYYDEVNSTLDERTDLLRRLRVVLECVGKGKLLKEIDTATIAEAIRKRRKYPGRSPAPATINRDLIDHTLRPLLNRARKVWGARTLPAIDWRSVRLREPKGIVREYSDAELEAWRTGLEPVPRFALDLMLTYGLRFGELFFFPAAVDGKAMRLTINAVLSRDGDVKTRKSGHSLSLPLRAEHARLLAAMASTRKADQTVFDFTYWGLHSRLSTAASRAGLGERAIHGARHHAATKLLRSTGNLKLTQNLLGHASIQSTMRYAHASEADLRAAINGLSPACPEVDSGDDANALKAKAK